MEALHVDPAVETLVAELVETIEAEIRVFQELLDTLMNEQKALLHYEPQALEASVEVQQTLARTGTDLEVRRADIVGRLSSAMDEDGASLTLQRLIERVKGPQAGHLGDMRETLLGLQESIQRANRHNALLINQSMKYVDKSLHLLTGMGGSTGAYAQTGKAVGGAPAPQTMVDQMA